MPAAAAASEPAVEMPAGAAASEPAVEMPAGAAVEPAVAVAARPPTGHCRKQCLFARGVPSRQPHVQFSLLRQRSLKHSSSEVHALLAVKWFGVQVPPASKKRNEHVCVQRNKLC